MTPLLIAGFGVPAPVAVGTDLACAAVTKTAATLARRATRTLSLRVAALLAAGSVPAAILALAWLASVALAPQDLARVIRQAIGIALIASIAALALRTRIRRWSAGSSLIERLRPHRPAATVLVGGLIGAAVALTSLGAGAIGAACLALLYPELEPAEIAGSDIAHAVPLTAIAAIGHVWLGTVDAGLLWALLCGGVPGIVAGSLITHRIPPALLRVLLIAVLGIAAGKLLL